MERRTPDASVADAMNRVLAAEQAAAGAIASAGSEADALIEAARARRRQILDTARRRASTLHARAQARLLQEIQELEAEAAAPRADPAHLRSLSQAALENLTRRLLAPEHEPG
jgi:vacuolar-type H+-ATPase subunit H